MNGNLMDLRYDAAGKRWKARMAEARRVVGEEKG